MAKSKGRRLAEWLRNLDSSGTVSNLTSTGIDDNATSTAITIDASENVGIGTASPADELHVNSTSVNVNLRLTRDTNTGARISGSDGASTPVIKFDTIASGTATERMRISSSGNVGIGTASPDGKLNVFSASAGSVSADADADELVLENSGNVGLSLLTAGTGESGIYFGNPGTNGQKDFYLKFYHESHATTANRRAFTFNTASTERMRIDASGKVGIGTDSPARILHIEKDGLADLLLRDTSTYSAGTGPAVIFQGNDSGSTITQFGAIYGVSNGSNSGELTFETRNSGSSVERMRIAADGKVGIGTTSPNALLHVSSSGNGEIEVERVGGALINLQAQSAVGVIGTDSNHDLRFKTNGGVRASITSTGNVGIGTTGPNYSLDVVGAIRATNSSGSTIIANRTSNPGSVELQHSGTQTAQFSALSGGGVVTYTGSTPTERMRISSAGNVGIGTTGPTNPLTVQANSGAGAVALNGRSSDGIATLGFYASNGTTAQGYVQGRSDSLRLWAASGDYLSLGSSDTERMRIDSSGNVGIGTTGPNAPLTIGGAASNAGNAAVSIYRSGNGYGNVRSTSNYGVSFLLAGASDNADELRLTQDNTKNGYLYNEANAPLVFGTNNTERMRIDSSGNVGIATTPASWGSSSTVLHVGDASGFWNFSLGANRQTNIVHNLYYDGQFKPRVTDGYGSMHIVTPGQNDAATFNFYSGNGTANTAVSLNQIATLSQNGLNFGTDTAAANALDDYEEGTWSATDASGQGLTVTTNRSYYIKVGSLVHISASIVFPTTSNTTNITLNIPFTSNITGFYAGEGGHGYTNMNDSIGDTLVSVIENSGANVLFYRNGDQRVRYSDVSGNRLDFHATYQRT